MKQKTFDVPESTYIPSKSASSLSKWKPLDLGKVKNDCADGFFREEMFDVKVDPFYSEENMAELRRRVKSIEDGTAKFVTHDLVEGK